MAELATLARPYANALFASGKANAGLEAWSRALNVLSAAVDNDTVRTLLEAPDVAGAQKAFKLAEVCGDELDDRARKMLQVLAANDRLGLIPEIREQFEIRKAAEEKSLEVEVITAYPLEASQAEALKQALQTKYAKDVNLESRVDAQLIGGAIIRAGDTVIDGSVQGRLEKLSETLLRS